MTGNVSYVQEKEDSLKANMPRMLSDGNRAQI